MSAAIRVRPARKDELRDLARLSARAFKGRPMSDALFPKRLRAKHGQRDDDDDDDDVLVADEEMEWRAERYLRVLDAEHRYLLVAVDQQDVPVGCAVWESHLHDKVALAEEVKKLAHDAPPGMDRDAAAVIGRTATVLEEAAKAALGKDGFEDSWYLAALCVDPAHQRKGIGKMLMQWGQERADQERKALWLGSTEAGAKLYRALGFEEVVAIDCLGGMEYAFVKRAA